MLSLALSYLLSAVSLFVTVSGHGTCTGFIHNNTRYEGIYPQTTGIVRPQQTIGWIPKGVTDNGGPVRPDGYNTSDIICNRGAVPAPFHVEVNAGDPITVVWANPWPWTHKGPVLNYMANCHGPCDVVVKEDLEWFKISEGGIVKQAEVSPELTSNWTSDYLVSDDSTWTDIVPPDLKAGYYVYRHETIALHNGHDFLKTENYPNCFNLAVRGGGSLEPKGIKATEFYTPTDPGILVHIYVPLDNYTIPGPPVYNSNAKDATVITEILPHDAELPHTLPAAAYHSASATQSPIVLDYTPTFSSYAPPPTSVTDLGVPTYVAAVPSSSPSPDATAAAASASASASASAPPSSSSSSSTPDASPAPASMNVYAAPSPSTDAAAVAPSSADAPASTSAPPLPSSSPSSPSQQCEAQPVVTETAVATVTVTADATSPSSASPAVTADATSPSAIASPSPSPSHSHRAYRHNRPGGRASYGGRSSPAPASPSAYA
ncbi:MAG: hypothetical protein M1826_005027 [Phylliscum demangeonii]|nr:MAG: hypothetical protein M1826_005027 [Phylliscum demangeonii]